jgi:transposase
VVNAHHIKHVPGRKTDMGDSQWLAELGRFALVRGSFVPPEDLRELRLISRYRKKLTGTLSGETNRLQKLLDDAGVKLGAAVSDINGVSAQAMLEGLIDGCQPEQLIALAKGRLKGKREELLLALGGELSARRRLATNSVYTKRLPAARPTRGVMRWGMSRPGWTQVQGTRPYPAHGSGQLRGVRAMRRA